MLMPSYAHPHSSSAASSCGLLELRGGQTAAVEFIGPESPVVVQRLTSWERVGASPDLGGGHRY